ncbi:hypothetical protein [Nonomuraea angiospora]|uniref:hypothetical protein n=1 Tax=Nonomuraea angiospora TaxID=46172 RepID=UPI0029A4732A|nr:hypothetical protein [Nonomuraea angiospora]MDX3105298.1 hypothetical protein [Nonomuraea angiospora]
MSGSLSMALVAALVPAARAQDDPESIERTAESGEAAGTAETAPAATTPGTADNLDRRRRHRRFPLIHGDRCSPHLFFKVHTLSPRNFFLPRTNYVDGPGGTVTASVTREHEVRAFLETENERAFDIETERPEGVNAANLIRQLRHFRRMGLPHLEERHMVFTGHEYSREITKGMYGHLWYRVFGYRVGWSAWRVMGTCRDVRVASGYANIPARVEGWRYWETKYPTFKHRRLPWKP